MSHRLTFCSNILPGSGFDEHFASLQESIPAIKGSCPWLKHLGLRLSQPMTMRLLSDSLALEDFNLWLRQMELKISTVNIFPYDDFSSEGLKEKVYLPDWTSQERCEYSLNAARLLCELETTEIVSMSTVPLGYKFHYNQQNFGLFDKYLIKTLEGLADLQDKKTIRLCLEPEPDCILENRFEVISFFEHLRKVASSELTSCLGICFDTCHFAVNFEQTDKALFELQQANIPVFKFQLSSALRWSQPLNTFSHKTLLDPVYLHQSRLQTERGHIQFEKDVLTDLEELNSVPGEWRCHFHTPIYLERYSDFESTQKDIVDAVNYSKKMALNDCDFEVETYTWSVLPGAQKGNAIEECVSKELTWAKDLIDG